MSNVIGGKVYVAPNGETKVRIYPHGFIEPVGEIPIEIGRVIEAASFAQAEMLGMETPATEVFEAMGWKPMLTVDEVIFSLGGSPLVPIDNGEIDA